MIKEFEGFINNYNYDCENQSLPDEISELCRKIKTNEDLDNYEDISSEIGKIEDIIKKNIQNINVPYIGAGNPNSKVIFIGKELAFDTSNIELLIHEQLTNLLKWKKIIKDYKNNVINFNYVINLNKNYFDTYVVNFEDKYVYCPLNPLTSSIIAPMPKSAGHNWAFLKYIIEHLLYNLNSRRTQVCREKFSNSLFKDCFTTEMNICSSKRTGGQYRLNPVFCSPLFIDFIKNFKVIWFHCRPYLKEGLLCDKYNNKTYKDVIKEIFDAEEINSEIDKVDIFKSKNCSSVIVVSNNLSGRNYSNNDLNKIIAKIKQLLECNK